MKKAVELVKAFYRHNVLRLLHDADEHRNAGIGTNHEEERTVQRECDLVLRNHIGQSVRTEKQAVSRTEIDFERIGGHLMI